MPWQLAVLLQPEAPPGAHYQHLQPGDGLQGIEASVLVRIGDLCRLSLHDNISPSGLLALAIVPSGAAEEPPVTLEELIATVEEYKDSLDEQEARETRRSMLPTARTCIESGGGAFEYKLKNTAQALGSESA